MSEASTSYKKQDGTFSLSADGRTVSWRPKNSAGSTLSINVAEITNLQQTPEKNPKVSIKIVVTKPTASEPENYTFQFTSSSARADQVAITAQLRKSIESARAQNGVSLAPTPAPAPDEGSGQSAAMAIAQAVSAGARAEDNTLDDSRLMANAELQKSLLNSSPALRQRFDQALRDKPDTITISQFATQFWATRVHLLRSHAVERSQNHGTYNVLTEVTPKNIDGVKKLQLTKEQIQLIFNQHPFIKKVYNENVPPLSESEFWARFFVSRLFKKLKGEKIMDTDSLDPKLDKYLNYEDESDRARQLTITSVPHFIDIEGHEQNHSQRQGNKLDFTMQPSSHDKVPILRVLNRMSEKMMADVPPSDNDPHAPVGMDEDTYNQLQLRDLQRATDDNRIILKIRNQSEFFSADQSLHTSSSASAYAKRKPSEVMSAVQADFARIMPKRSNTAGLDLEPTIGVIIDESSSDEETNSKKQLRVGSRSSRTVATKQIIKAVRDHQDYYDDLLHSLAESNTTATKMGLSQPTFDNLTMTHNTTVEFLHYFWTVFLSGDADRASEVQKLVETLDRSLDRINAVAEGAEKERVTKVEKEQKRNEEYTQRTGKRRRLDPNSIKGGAKVVNDIMRPIKRAIQDATEQYRKAYEAQVGQLAQT